MLTPSRDGAPLAPARCNEFSMSDIFTEVDEDVRREKAEEFWKKYQNYIFALAALIVLAAGAYRYFEYSRGLAAQAAGGQFLSAIELDQQGKGAEADAILTRMSSDSSGGYRVLARLAEAGVKSKTDVPGALKAYDGLANDAAIGELFQDAARLRAALLRLDNGETETAKPVLEALSGDTSPFRHSAREALGALALSAGDIEGAGKWLDMAISDPQTPPGVKKNAETMLGLVAAGKPAK